MLVCVLSRPFQWTCKSCMASHVLVGDCILVLLEKQHVFGCICGLFMLASVGYLRLPLWMAKNNEEAVACAYFAPTILAVSVKKENCTK